MGQGAITKDRILQAALDIFAQQGFQGARMEKIALAVGINKASLYFHFKSKDEIFAELFHSILIKHQAKLNNIFEEAKSLPVKQSLILIYTRYLEYNWNNAEMDFWNRIYYTPPEMMRDTIINATLQSYNTLTSDIAKIMEAGILKKELKPLSAMHMAKTFYYLITCISISTDLMDLEQGLKEMDNCFEIFWEGIKGM